MALSMYDVSVPAYRQMLGGLSGVLQKAIDHFAAEGRDPTGVAALRLIDDMAPFTFQVSQAIAHSKGAIRRLRGEEPEQPPMQDTLPAMKAAVDETIAWLAEIKPEEIEGTETRDVVMRFPGGETPFKGQAYLLSFALPNFYFHCATAYGLMRAQGVPIGKRDFMGRRG